MERLLQDMEFGGPEERKILVEAQKEVEEKTRLYRDNLYAGCVMKHNPKKGKTKICRKILFTMNSKGDVEDVLFDSPTYSVKRKFNNPKFFVSYVTKLNKILEHYDYNYELYDKDIREIYSFFLSKNALFFKEHHIDLPMTLNEFAYLEIISKQSKKPTRTEKKEFEKFKPKTKTYTFR